MQVCKCFFPRWGKAMPAMRLLQQDRASYDTSCTQSRNKCTAHQWKPCLSSAHGEDGRGTWAQCKGRSSSENTMQRHHVTLFHACSNRKQYRWFSLPTVAYQMQWVHINQCVRNALKYQKPWFFGTPDNSWAPGNHTREEWDWRQVRLMHKNIYQIREWICLSLRRNKVEWINHDAI